MRLGVIDFSEKHANIGTLFWATVSGKDPKSLKDAMNSPEWPEWKKAIRTELETLQRMGTWELVDAPEDRKPITNKWVFVRKYDKDGNLQKYKARLVARGFSQMPGMDYNETFSPVVLSPGQLRGTLGSRVT